MATPGPRCISLDHVDEATLAVIEQILSEDIEELENRDKGKQREGEKSDAHLAVDVYRSELRQFRTILADGNMSHSLARAVLADSALMTAAVAKEDSFANDRLLAERLSRGEEIPSNTGEVVSGDPRLDDLFIARLTGLYVSNKDGDCLPPKANGQEGTAPESSRSAERSVTSAIPRLPCVSFVSVVLNSATFVESAGRPVAAPNGVKIVFSLAPNKWWHVSSLSMLFPLRNTKLKCSKQPNTSAIAIIVLMKDGNMLEDHIDGLQQVQKKQDLRE
ncbi:MAG: hypothetical protein Q9212_005805 [Teloschistes hypoglaucus]